MIGPVRESEIEINKQKILILDQEYILLIDKS